jgi:hypothetical protein
MEGFYISSLLLTMNNRLFPCRQRNSGFLCAVITVLMLLPAFMIQPFACTAMAHCRSISTFIRAPSAFSILARHALASWTEVAGRHGSARDTHSSSSAVTEDTVVIPEHEWRSAAQRHQEEIFQLLQLGLLPPAPLRRRHQPTKGIPWTALDTRHPVYNFLIEYYGLKGTKGPRRLARWSPPFTRSANREVESDSDNASSSGAFIGGGVFLEGATMDDLGSLLHLRGATVVDTSRAGSGILYNPGLFFGKGEALRRGESQRAATSFLWYRSILQNTAANDPVLHCYGLHEWAMQYWPAHSPPPPSSKYQAHLPLRVSQQVINEVVERKGVLRCTHVDALRFFAPAAGPLNHHGANLLRTDQLQLEQPACIHATMDLLKIVLKLQPFVDAALIVDVLRLALRARTIDIAASPYDVTTTYNIAAIPIETTAGRAAYQQEQLELMKDSCIVRGKLLQAYESFLSLAFDESTIDAAHTNPLPEDRFAATSPGSQPWRRNSLPVPSLQSTVEACS